jgi:O-antigen ligase
MQVRPQWGWTPIHPNYVAGIVSITTPFVICPASTLIKKNDPYSTLFVSLILAGSGLALFAIIMTTSRGIIMAFAGAFGIWLGWRGIELNGSRLRLRWEAFFPFLVLLFLCAVIILLYAGPATSTSNLSSQYYGTGSRSELLTRSLFLVFDFPFTGGGLKSFPGLYSHYMLGIPFFNVVNSHNLFLDVAIEQGWLGGLSFLAIFLTSIWRTAKATATDAVRGEYLSGSRCLPSSSLLCMDW